MMTHIEFQTPAPYCLLPTYHPSRAHIPACKTDVSETIRQHQIETQYQREIEEFEYTEER